jgi:hypothetical protein
VALVDFLASHPDLESTASAYFIRGVRDETLSPELVAFAMHFLRYQAVLQSVQSMLAEHGEPILAVGLRNVRDAYSDSWEAADLYEKKRRPSGP